MSKNKARCAAQRAVWFAGAIKRQAVENVKRRSRVRGRCAAPGRQRPSENTDCAFSDGLCDGARAYFMALASESILWRIMPV
nr:hypothetical protein [Kingella potus]